MLSANIQNSWNSNERRESLWWRCDLGLPRMPKDSSHNYQRHEAVSREMAKLRRTLATDTQEMARKEYFRNIHGVRSRPTDKTAFLARLILNHAVRTVLTMSTGTRTRSCLPRSTLSLNGLTSWTTFTDLKRRIMTRTSCSHIASSTGNMFFKYLSSCSLSSFQPV